MKRKITSLVSGLCFAFAASLSAQEAQENQQEAPQEENLGPVAAPADALQVTEEDSAANMLENVKTEAGLDADRFFTSIKVQKIGKSPSDPKYVLAIQEAYRAAWEDAIVEIIEGLQNDLSQAVENGMLSDTNGLKKGDLDPKVAQLINAELKKQLVAQGVDLNNPEAIKAALPKVAESQSTKSAIAQCSKLYLAGIIAHKTIVKNGEVGVLAYYSPAMKKIADCLVAKRPFQKLPPRQRIALQLRKIPAKELVSSLGTRLYIDENGNPCIVAFAIERIVGNSSIAAKAADMNARGFIADFVGTSVAVANEKASARDIATLEDSMGNTTSVAEVSSKMKSLAKRGTAKMTFQGVKSALRKELKLPSGQRVVVQALVWSPAISALAAEAVRGGQESQALREQSGNGTKAVPPRRAPAKPAPAKPAFQNKDFEGSGTTGVVL